MVSIAVALYLPIFIFFQVEIKPVVIKFDVMSSEGNRSVSVADSALFSSGHEGGIIKDEKNLIPILKRKGEEGTGIGEYIEEEDNEYCPQSSTGSPKKIRTNAEEQAMDTGSSTVSDKTALANTAKKKAKRSQASLLRRSLKRKARTTRVLSASMSKAITSSSNRSIDHREVARSATAVLTVASAATANQFEVARPESVQLRSLANGMQKRVDTRSPSSMAGKETPHALHVTSTKGVSDIILCLDVEVVSDGAYSQFSQLGAVLSTGGRISTFEAKVCSLMFCPNVSLRVRDSWFFYI
jgi:hypothetical protein